MKQTHNLPKIMTKLGADYLPTDNLPTDTTAWVAPVCTVNGEVTVKEQDAIHGQDIYALLGQSSELWADSHEMIVLWTAGWAAPANGGDDEYECEVPPSLHPQKKRVAMVCLATKAGDFGSALMMWGNSDFTEPLVEMNGRGALRDCALSIWE